MPNQDHICIAITKSNMGGAQKYVLTLADEFHKQGKKVTVVAGGDGILFDELEKRGISYIKLAQSHRDISLFKEFKLARELYSIFREIKPTVLQLNSSKLGGLGAFVGRIAGIKKIIFTAHGWAFNEVRSPLQKKVLYVLYWITIFLSSKTICVSKQTRDQISFLPFIKSKLVTIYNGVQVPEFYSFKESREILSEQFLFLDINKKWIVILAELHYTKGHDLLIEAVNSLREKLANYQIICIGSGEREEKLKALVYLKNLDDYVFFTGFLKDAPLYLKGFEALCLPSRTEALPLVILEAGLAKIPVIASEVGGIPEIIEDEVNGFLFEKENVEKLEEKLEIVVELSQEDKGEVTERLYEKICRDFSVEKMVEETLKVF